MTFCPNCGSELPGGAKFCAGCGAALSNSGYVLQPQQQVTKVIEAFEDKIRNTQDPKLVGIFKQLESNEKVMTQSLLQTQVIFVKEAQIKKVFGQERKEVPLSISSSMFYLTNERLIFLKLFEISATELGSEINMLAGASGTFYEIPLRAVTGVDMRPVKLNKNDQERFLKFFNNDKSKLEKPALEIIYDEKAATGRAKDYMESMLQRGALSKLWGKVEMVYDKIFVLGEQATVLQPLLSDYIRKNKGDK